jgi:site-specific DNA-methyltransferase (adenine-specific)
MTGGYGKKMQHGRIHDGTAYRSVDEFEYLYIFWKPGVTKIDRSRLTRQEWIRWGSKAVWDIPSVRSNANHDSKFPIELPRRAIKLFTDPLDIVLDCFIGSGTTAIAAISEERRYIGIDKEEKSVNISRDALAAYNKYSGRPVQMELMIQEIEATYALSSI